MPPFPVAVIPAILKMANDRKKKLRCPTKGCPANLTLGTSPPTCGRCFKKFVAVP